MGDEIEIVKGRLVENGGKWRNFDEMTREERQEMARRGAVARKRNREIRQLAQLEAYTNAHRELASQILGTKMTLLDGLVEEMNDPDTGRLDTKRLAEPRMKILVGLLDQLQKTAFPPTAKVEHSGQVDIRAVVADLTKKLSKDDD